MEAFRCRLTATVLHCFAALDRCAAWLRCLHAVAEGHHAQDPHTSGAAVTVGRDAATRLQHQRPALLHPGSGVLCGHHSQKQLMQAAARGADRAAAVAAAVLPVTLLWGLYPGGLPAECGLPGWCEDAVVLCPC